MHPKNKAIPVTDGVVLFHGILRTRRSMRGLARFLEGEGMRVLNVSYPSTRYPLEVLAERIHAEVGPFAEACVGPVHFVGYSMGGLLIRAYLAKYRPERPGRVVMIGTPNGGSEVADFVRNWRLYRWLYGPAGQQLITKQEAFAYHFGTLNCETGIIAGNRSVDPVSSRIIGKPNDGKVAIESTKLSGAKDHIVLPCSHTFFPSNREMWRQTLYFIQNGNFRR